MSKAAIKSQKAPHKWIILYETRCPNCNRLLGNLNGVYEIKCKKCKQIINGQAG